ncbi:MAG: response regulator [Bacteroidetes bacterium]|nr:response regulator [Bacteroidota bacterium]
MEKNLNNDKKIIDLTYLIGLSKGDNGFVKKMITVFLEETPKEVDVLEESVNQTDYEVIKASAHKLKSTIPFIGLDKIIGKEVNEIESLARENSGIENIRASFKKIKESFELASAELEAFMLNN